MSRDVAVGRWDALNVYVRSAMVAESARWGDSLLALGGIYTITRTRDVDWQNEVDLIRGLLEGNTERLLVRLENVGFYSFDDEDSSVTKSASDATAKRNEVTSGAARIVYIAMPVLLLMALF